MNWLKHRSKAEVIIDMINSDIRSMNDLGDMLHKVLPDIRHTQRINTIKGILHKIAYELSSMEGSTTQ